jgi:anthranilate phosphoribosyltransferase
MIKTFEISPEEVGLARTAPEGLRGGDAEANAAALLAVLEGKKDSFRDVAVFNAAAALLVAGRAKTLKDGVTQASQSIDSGAAAGRLERLIAVSNA